MITESFSLSEQALICNPIKDLFRPYLSSNQEALHIKIVFSCLKQIK
jgi:hypothetical protein